MAKKVEPFTREQKFSAARNTAQRRLREKHRKEWNELLLEELRKAGITDWVPPLTPEEKSAATIRTLLERLPTEIRREIGLDLLKEFGTGTTVVGGVVTYPRGQEPLLNEPPDPDNLEGKSTARKAHEAAKPFLGNEPSAPADPVLTRPGTPDPAEDFTQNDYAEDPNDR